MRCRQRAHRAIRFYLVLITGDVDCWLLEVICLNAVVSNCLSWESMRYPRRALPAIRFYFVLIMGDVNYWLLEVISVVSNCLSWESMRYQCIFLLMEAMRYQSILLLFEVRYQRRVLTVEIFSGEVGLVTIVIKEAC